MLQFFEYTLPFKKPFITGGQTFRQRSGLLVCFREQGYASWSEASPLPGFSADTIRDVKNLLEAKKSDISHFFSGDFSIQEADSFTENFTRSPALQFGLSYLALDLYSQRKGISKTAIFGVPGRATIGVNDVIGHASPREMENRIIESIRQGFTVIKVKALPPVNSLIAVLKTISKQWPQVRFRLDANQSWTLDEFRAVINTSEALPIEYIEEPFEHYPGTFLQKNGPHSIPVAFDESIKNSASLEEAIAQNSRDFFVIKPMRFGNLFRLFGTILKHRSNVSKVVVTTSLESVIGQSITGEITGLLGDSELSHGLHTDKFFNQNLLPVPEIKNGRLNLPALDLRTLRPDHLQTDFIAKWQLFK